MKKILLLIFFLPVFSFAGDWDLFRLNQASIFNYHYSNESKVGVQIMDSVKQNGNEVIFYFRRNLPYENIGQCDQSSFNHIPYPSTDYFSIDSLVERNDTVFSEWSYSSLPFYFLPKAAVGQSWTVTSTYSGNDYNQITINCAFVQLETFYGITDSVKTFTMTANGTSQNQVPVNNFLIKLSKDHGLIEYVPFPLFLYHPAGLNFFSAELIGIDSAGINYGFQRPGLQDYFHLNAGDVLNWMLQFTPTWVMYSWQEFFRDSITQVFSSPDSVVYQMDETMMDTDGVITQYPVTETYLRTAFTDLISFSPNWISFQVDPLAFQHRFYWAAGFPNTIWQNLDWLFKVDSLVSDTILESNFSTEDWGLDTGTCQVQYITDEYKSFTMNTRMGLTDFCYYNIDSYCYSLSGAIISGLQYGSTDLPLEINSPEERTSITLLPNPFRNTAQFVSKNSSVENVNYNLKIYNTLGILIHEEKILNLNSYILHRDGLGDGMYFYELRTLNPAAPSVSRASSELIGSGKFIVE